MFSSLVDPRVIGCAAHAISGCHDPLYKDHPYPGIVDKNYALISKSVPDKCSREAKPAPAQAGKPVLPKLGLLSGELPTLQKLP